jgi:hypothetical protein
MESVMGFMRVCEKVRNVRIFLGFLTFKYLMRIFENILWYFVV